MATCKPWNLAKVASRRPSLSRRRACRVSAAAASSDGSSSTGTAAQPAQPCRQFALRMCINTTCAQQGSEQVAQFIGGLGAEGLEVTGRDCLGNCGNGPNALLESPGCEDKQLAGLTGPEAAAQVLREHCGLDVNETVLRASDLRQSGGEAAAQGDLEAAEYLFTQGIEMQPSLGQHLLLMARSEVRLMQGNAEGGLADARAAAACAPQTFLFPFVLQVEALLQLGRGAEAGEALAAAVARSPAFAEDPDYAMLLEAVQEVQNDSYAP